MIKKQKIMYFLLVLSSYKFTFAAVFNTHKHKGKT